jgi:hypothetical protein
MRVNRDSVFVYCYVRDVGVDEGREHVDGEAGGDITAGCIDEYMSTREGKEVTDLSRFARRWRKVRHAWPWPLQIEIAGLWAWLWSGDGRRTAEGGAVVGVAVGRKGIGIGVGTALGAKASAIW